MAGISPVYPAKEFLMIDWNIGETAGSVNAGQKTTVLAASTLPPALLEVTERRTSVGQPSTRDALFQSTVSTALNGLAAIHGETRRLATAFRTNDLANAHRDFDVLV